MPKKNRDFLPFLIGLCVFILILFLLIAGGIGYYVTYHGYSGISAFQYSLADIAALRFHVSLEYKNYYIIAVAVYALCVLAFYTENGRYAHDADGIEAGSSKWNENLKIYNKRFTEPLGKPTNEGMDNTILSRNISLSLNDRKTNRNNNVIVLGPSGSGNSPPSRRPAGSGR